MATTSRRLSAAMRDSRPSRTPGKDKGERCTKSALKDFGRNANPYKLRGNKAREYQRYCSVTDAMNK